MLIFIVSYMDIFIVVCRYLCMYIFATLVCVCVCVCVRVCACMCVPDSRIRQAASWR